MKYSRGSVGERRKLPSAGQSPGRKRILDYLELEKNTPDSHKSVIFDISCRMYLVTFTYTITKHKTFTHIFVHFAQLKRLCNFFHSLWGPRPPHNPLWLRLWRRGEEKERFASSCSCLWMVQQLQSYRLHSFWTAVGIWRVEKKCVVFVD